VAPGLTSGQADAEDRARSDSDGSPRVEDGLPGGETISRSSDWGDDDPHWEWPAVLRIADGKDLELFDCSVRAAVEGLRRGSRVEIDTGFLVWWSDVVGVGYEVTEGFELEMQFKRQGQHGEDVKVRFGVEEEADRMIAEMTPDERTLREANFDAMFAMLDLMEAQADEEEDRHVQRTRRDPLEQIQRQRLNGNAPLPRPGRGKMGMLVIHDEPLPPGGRREQEMDGELDLWVEHQAVIRERLRRPPDPPPVAPPARARVSVSDLEKYQYVLLINMGVLTKAEAARRAGVSRTAMGNWVRDRSGLTARWQ
jgi:hypothetical protein